MTDRQQVIARTPNKEDWVEAVEKSAEYSSLSQLVNVAVEKELSDTYVHKLQTETSGNSTSDEKLNQLTDQLTEIIQRFDAADLSSSGTDELADLTTTLYSYLPRVHPEDVSEWLSTHDKGYRIPDEEQVSSYGRVDDMVEHIPETEWDVRKALAKAEADIGHVESATDADNNMRYYRVDDGATRMNQDLNEEGIDSFHPASEEIDDE